MAINTLRAESACANPKAADPIAVNPPEEFLARFSAYVRARAERDIMNFTPGTADEFNDQISKEHSKAMNSFMLTQAPDLPGLAKKLAIFRDEELGESWFMGAEIVDLLVADAQRLAADAQ